MRGQCVLHEKSDFDQRWHNINLAARSSTNVPYTCQPFLAFLLLFLKIRFQITGMLYRNVPLVWRVPSLWSCRFVAGTTIIHVVL